MERYICIHGHFYQPPRENAWLEAVELQDSAYPYHDWNERITAECYAPNGASRILDGERRIVKIANNYSQISFNFGPTLLAWLEEKSPETYQAVLEADKESRRNFSGHGSAMAQAYNHMIMPLANRRDKYTQVLWGLRDFEHRFGRKPEGMWLPETAVDLETLDIMAELGIRFTVLSPYQAKRVRKGKERNWTDVEGGKVDPTQAYEIRLPSRRRMNLFFYDGPISRAVAFEHLLTSGEHFSGRLLGAFSDSRNWPQVVHIATDGETYGHHQAHGDMALAYALQHIQSNHLARLTIYGEYLEKYPPTHEGEIIENTAWSCAHGVDRWKGDCGCNSGMNPGWNQAWRAPLREALDWLRDTLAPLYENKGRELLKDPWAARDAYIHIVLDRSPETIGRFFTQHAARELPEGDRIRALKLLELQRHAMLMYTSCGWFFDELSGIETVQVIQYAGRALQLSEELFGDTLEAQFLERLERAKSNIPEHRDGRHIYEKWVKAAMVDLKGVAAHYAIRSLFEPYAEHDEIYCYKVDREDFQISEAGKTRLVVGRVRFASQIILESAPLTFGVLHFGDHNVSGGVRDFRGEEAYQNLSKEINEAFSRADLPEVIRVLDKGFGRDIFSLKSLFRDDQRKVLDQILTSALSEAETAYRQLFEHQAALLRFLADLGQAIPKSLRVATELALNMNLRRAIDELDLGRVLPLVEEAKRYDISIDGALLGYRMKEKIGQMAIDFRTQPANMEQLRKLEGIVNLACSLPFEVDLWKPQNVYFEMARSVYPEFRKKAEAGEEAAKSWVELFTRFGEKLSCRFS
jgi:alpha-amylase/alpha-mannosidase (GH57 family)